MNFKTNKKKPGKCHRSLESAAPPGSAVFWKSCACWGWGHLFPPTLCSSQLDLTTPHTTSQELTEDKGKAIVPGPQTFSGLWLPPPTEN